MHFFQTGVRIGGKSCLKESPNALPKRWPIGILSGVRGVCDAGGGRSD
jgi:hypothetical protein